MVGDLGALLMRTKDVEQGHALVRAAIDAGITFFDTANIPSRS
jgi:aryl-alcohol dehydrogenase-like predicted oxidoreductase